ncbi:MAG: DEAD/DEAH box helicase family protein [Syntrophales bacterium]|jgi:type III restriction enzyme|nr:DEAD/DEAH box helicase family protein [Syntrophales bacterium]
MILKRYQSDALDWFEKFLKRCRESGQPRESYAQTTQEWRDMALFYRPLRTLETVPYVCVRIPTGGGKTLVAGMAIERVNRSLLHVPYSLSLWLVPSEPIREQTLKALRDKTSILCQSVSSALGELTVLDIEGALRVTPHVLNGSNVIIVATMQAFKQEETGRLSVYKQNGSLMEHFEGISDPEVRGNGSLVDVLRLRSPFVIVDEAHNQGTSLAFETLARFEPCAILELTATPDRIWQPSNVLFSVSASVLHSEDMIKMPLTLVQRPNWLDALRDAIACLNQLHQAAEAERSAGGNYLRPIMLLQAERRDADHETLTPERVKKALTDDFGIPEREIAIATGTMDEIADINILSENCPFRFIITVDKLREGWDCPFAYVLCSLRNTSSATAAEQILGRILRQPYAQKKDHPELNMAYAYLTSSNFAATVESLKDGLVRNGFERQEARELINIPDGAQTEDLFSQQQTSITYSTPELPETESIPDTLMKKIEITPENGSITLKGSFTETQVKTLQDVFHTPAGKQAVQEAITRMRSPRKAPPKSPAEQGELFKVPRLQLRQGGLWEPFEETHLLQGDWSLIDYPCDLPSFSKVNQNPQGGLMYLEKEKVKFTFFQPGIAEPVLFEYQSGWSQASLVYWLDRNIYDENLLPDEKAAFLNKAIDWLKANGFTLEELAYAKFRLRNALEAKIGEAKRLAMKRVHQELLLTPEEFVVNDRNLVVFEQGRYAYDSIYCGFTELPKHFFPLIGNLKGDGEEFECALFLATQLEGVNCWVRNVERKPTSFSLQTGSDRFYPDFLCQMVNGTVLAVEYKNSRDWDLPENIEKRQLGELWERRSNGSCFFTMPRGKDFEEIRRKAGEALKIK